VRPHAEDRPELRDGYSSMIGLFGLRAHWAPISGAGIGVGLCKAGLGLSVPGERRM
jgi:hypothetical protein